MFTRRKSLGILGFITAVSLLMGGCRARNNTAKTDEVSATTTSQEAPLTLEQRTQDGGIKKFISSPVEDNTVAIFEPNNYHHECIPGYAKYFVDLGYNVELLIIKGNEDSMELFEPKDKIKIYTYDNLEGILPAAPELANKFSKYNHVLVNSLGVAEEKNIKKLKFLDNSNSLFVVHNTDFIKELKLQSYVQQNKIITLGDLKKALYVNPNYFGNITRKPKNKKTRFFMTSTFGRKYDKLVNAFSELKNKNLDFEVMVSGRSETFGVDNLPENLKQNFVFRYGIPYSEMYKEVQNSDFIIMTLDPENKNDRGFKTTTCTGTAQLIYGFLKPAVVDKDFAKCYKLNSENSLVHQTKDFSQCLEKAINMNQEEYSEVQNNLEKTVKSIYNQSLENLKKALGE